jgi:hypothetical protein
MLVKIRMVAHAKEFDVPIEVEETCTIADLRQAVQLKLQQQVVDESSALVLASIQKGRLIYAGRILDDGNLVGDVGVQEGHVVHLVKSPAAVDTSVSLTTSAATTTAAVPGAAQVIPSPIIVQQQQGGQQQFAVRINLNPVAGAGGGAQQISLTFPTATQVHVQTGNGDAAAPVIQAQTPVVSPMPAVGALPTAAPQVQVVPVQLPNGQVQLVPIAAPAAAQVCLRYACEHRMRAHTH